MKIPWTTITEDESTWPPEDKLSAFSKQKVCRREGASLRVTGYPESWIHSIELCFGQQWRPMPKPPKKKNQMDGHIRFTATF